MREPDSVTTPAKSTEPGVVLSNVSKSFQAASVLGGVSFSAPKGKLTALLGPSGSGKSTLLRIIAGLDRPDSGTVEIGPRDVTALPPQKRSVGLVFQNYALFPHLDVFENVAFGLRVQKKLKSTIEGTVMDLLSRVRLADKARRNPSELSGGERQRVALARALAIQPDVLLLDEPFAALDAEVRTEMRRWLLDIHHQTGITTILVTHDQHEALELADHIVLLRDGRVVQAGTPVELYENPVDLFAARFTGPVNEVTVNGELRWVRPGRVYVTADSDQANAEVESVVFLGEVSRLTLRLSDGQTVVAHCPSSDNYWVGQAALVELR